MKLIKILEPLAKELRLVEKEMKDQLKNISIEQSLIFLSNEYIKKRVKYLFQSTGKLLRPALVLLSAKSVNGTGTMDYNSLIKLATVVEFIHSSSLIHDDIIDETDYRREQISLNKQFGNQAAVLIGDIINSQFMSILATLENVSYKTRIMILELFSKTIKKMCLGEIYEQRIKRNKINPTMNEYLEIIKNKTASLMSASCLCGAYMGGANKKECEVLKKYGLYFGLAFQIADDCHDNDSIYNSKEDLIEKAEEYVRQAETEINKLNHMFIKQNLLHLNKYIIDTAKKSAALAKENTSV